MADSDGFQLRPAGDGDLAELLVIDHEVRFAPDQPAHATEWLDPDPAVYIGDWIARGECVVAEMGGGIAGFGVMHYHFFHSGFIDLVMVRPALRRRGIARALVRHLAATCTSPKVWISTNLSNTPMQRLLAAEGFAMSGFIEGLDAGDPELVYNKPKPGALQR